MRGITLYHAFLAGYLLRLSASCWHVIWGSSSQVFKSMTDKVHES